MTPSNHQPEHPTVEERALKKGRKQNAAQDQGKTVSFYAKEIVAKLLHPREEDRGKVARKP